MVHTPEDNHNPTEEIIEIGENQCVLSEKHSFSWTTPKMTQSECFLRFLNRSLFKSENICHFPPCKMTAKIYLSLFQIFSIIFQNCFLHFTIFLCSEALSSSLFHAYTNNIPWRSVSLTGSLSPLELCLLSLVVLPSFVISLSTRPITTLYVPHSFVSKLIHPLFLSHSFDFHKSIA